MLHLVHVLARGSDRMGAPLADAENIGYDDVLHFGSPAHQHTRDVLARELAVVAARVPVVTHAPPAAPAPLGELPPPKEAERDDWDFLKPDPHNGPGRPMRPVHPSSER